MYEFNQLKVYNRCSRRKPNKIYSGENPTMAEKVAKAPLSAEDRLFNKNKWLFSVSGIGRDMSYQLISSFLLTYIQFGMTLSIAQFTTISLLIGIAGRIWDAVNDPMMGAIIEGTHMKMGKFRPWILIGAVLTGVTIVAMFNVQSLSGWSFVIYMAVMYLIWESAFTMNDIGYWSMLASLSSKKEQRNSATMLTVVFAGVGAFIAQGGISFLYPGNVLQAFSWISIAIAAIFVAMQVIMVLFIKERPRAAMEVNEKVSLKQMWNTIKRNDQVLWMTLSMLFYNVGSSMLVGLAYNLYYLEIGYDGLAIVFIAIFGVFNIGAQVFYPKLSQKLGRKKLQTLSVILACVGYIGVALLGWTSVLPFNLVTLSIFGVFVFVGQAWYYMGCIINMTNCVEYNEYKHGERNEAVVSTLRPFMVKFADALKYGIVTLVLTVSLVYGLSQNISTMEVQKGHFDRMETGVQQAEYLTGLKAVYDKYKVLPSKDSADYQKQIEAINAEIDAMNGLHGKQIDVNYLSSLGDTYIVGKKVIRSGFLIFTPEESEIVFAYKVSELDEAKIAEIQAFKTADNSANSCTLTISSGEMVTTGGKTIKAFNAANQNFKETRTIGMRLWVRAAVTLVPVVCLLISLFVQNKKFFIDEKYYDMMLAEIAKRSGTEECIVTPASEAEVSAEESL